MSRDEDAESSIVRLSTVMGVRLRPAMYVGPLDRPEAILTLLADGLCLSMDGALSGATREIRITLHRDGSVSVWDDGPGPSVSALRGGLGLIEKLLTELYACRRAKQSAEGKSLCGVGIVITNAFSEWLTFETVQSGWLWRQQFVRGEPTGPIARIKPQEAIWHRLAFLPDREFFAETRLTSDLIRSWFAEESFNLPATTLTLIDQVSGNTFELNRAAVS